MQAERPYVLTVAGFDPSSGAGVTADIKTFEQHKVYGLAVCTGMTVQTEDEFHSVSWRTVEEVKTEVELLLKKYPVKAVKFGIVPSFEFLKTIIAIIKKHNSSIKIVVDPIWRASAGPMLNESPIELSALNNIELLTPNIPELEYMAKGKNRNEFIKEIVSYSNILLKGGHSVENTGTDTLHTKNKTVEFLSAANNIHAKHGSGCVLSAAITAQLALGKNLEDACAAGKCYIENFLATNKSLLGYHAA